MNDEEVTPAPYREAQRNRRPAWVRIGLCGVQSRRPALMFGWGCLAASPLISIMGFLLIDSINHTFAARISPVLALLGLPLCLLSSWWYFAAIKWVDHHDDWQ